MLYGIEKSIQNSGAITLKVLLTDFFGYRHISVTTIRYRFSPRIVTLQE